MRSLITVTAGLIMLFGCGERPAGSPPEAAGSPEAAAETPGLEFVEQTDDYGYRERFQRRIADGVREGRYQRYNPQGQLIEEAFFRSDTLDGNRVFFFPGGDTLSVERYDRGIFQGEFRQYYENGQLQLQGMYVDNEMTGAWRQYYDTGELMEVVTFRDNAENGPFVEYFRNGNLKAEGAYRDGDNEHGLLKLYDESGRLVRRMDCEMGACRTIWKADD